MPKANSILIPSNQIGRNPAHIPIVTPKKSIVFAKIRNNTNALNNLSLRGVERRSNPQKKEIAAPFGNIELNYEFPDEHSRYTGEELSVGIGSLESDEIARKFISVFCPLGRYRRDGAEPVAPPDRR